MTDIQLHTNKRFVNLTGQKFGRWQVMQYAGRHLTSRAKEHQWTCRCECGTIREVDVALLRNKRSMSCGCLKNEKFLKICTTHGQARSPIYKIWVGILQRCANPKNASYKNYGGRGITVCDRWRDSFENFLADMGERPEGHSIDRINNDLGYYKKNCRWATPKEQSNNRRPRKKM